jgi:outer membrane immunogenic protein
MKRLLLSAAALGLFAVTGSAFAAEMPLKAPPPLPTWSWTGFYVGANAGYSWGTDSTDSYLTSTSTSVVTATTPAGVPIAGNGTTTVSPTTIGAGNASGDMDGWLGGFQAGYNWQHDQWVLGLETDFQWTGERDDPTFCSATGCPTGSFIGTNTTSLPWFGTLRGRLGITSQPGDTSWGPVLLYATGGLAYGRIDESYSMGLVGGPTSAASFDTTRAGWTVGGGGEARIGQSNWTVKIEYLYVDFGDVSGGVSATGAPVITPFGINNSDQIHYLTTTTAMTGSASTHVTDNILRIGLDYHFGWQ